MVSRASEEANLYRASDHHGDRPWMTEGWARGPRGVLRWVFLVLHLQLTSADCGVSHSRRHSVHLTWRFFGDHPLGRGDEYT